MVREKGAGRPSDAMRKNSGARLPKRRHDNAKKGKHDTETLTVVRIGPRKGDRDVFSQNKKTF
jgi:hypothetical protein